MIHWFSRRYSVLLVVFIVAGTMPGYGQSMQQDRALSKEISEVYKQPDSLFLQWKHQYEQAIAHQDTAIQGKCLQEMGRICYHLGYFSKAMEYYLEAENLLTQTGQKMLLAQNFIELGTLHYYNRDTAGARHSFEQAKALFTQLHDRRGIAQVLGKFGHLMEKRQQYDSAFHFQFQALALYSGEKDSAGIAGIYEHLGSIHEDLGQYDSALVYFTRAFAWYDAAGDKTTNIGVLNNIGDIYRKRGNLDTGLLYTFKAMEAAGAQEELYQLSAAYRDLSRTYNLMHKDDSAYYYSETSRSLLLQIYSKEGNKQIALLQVLNDLDKKNNEIRYLQKDKRFNTALSIATLIIILLLIIVGLAVLSRQRLKLKSEQEHNHQKSKIFDAQKMLMESDLKAAAMEEAKLKAELLNRQLENEKLAIELRSRELEEEQWKQAVALKSKELSTHVLHIIQKNQLLESLKQQLELMVKDDKRDQKKQLRAIVQQINHNYNNDKNWQEFSIAFEEIHQSFFKKISAAFPDLTATDLKLISLLKMNMDSADMATMLGISPDSLRVSRHSLRKKLNLSAGEHLVSFLQGY